MTNKKNNTNFKIKQKLLKNQLILQPILNTYHLIAHKTKAEKDASNAKQIIYKKYGHINTKLTTEQSTIFKKFDKSMYNKQNTEKNITYKSQKQEFMTIYDNQTYKYIKNTTDLFLKANKSSQEHQNNQHKEAQIYHSINHILDLHGYCYESSKALLDMFFEQAIKANLIQINIITGPGPILKEGIKKFLQQPRLNNYIKKIQSYHGHFVISLKK